MAVRLKNGNSISEDMIAKLEGQLGYVLSEPVKDFLRRNNGATPEMNQFRVSDRNRSRVTRFIPAEEIVEERLGIENLPVKAYPIAYDSFGNYILVDEGENGRIYFWDHEQPENMVILADDFEQFLSLLEPFDPHSVELKPGQVVKRVWVDPRFVKNPKKKS